MIRKNVNLTEQHVDFLKRRALYEQRSESKVLRKIIDHYLEFPYMDYLEGSLLAYLKFRKTLIPFQEICGYFNEEHNGAEVKVDIISCLTSLRKKGLISVKRLGYGYYAELTAN